MDQKQKYKMISVSSDTYQALQAISLKEKRAMGKQIAYWCEEYTNKQPELKEEIITY